MSSPLVSIGVPVYNDEKWLRRSLDHLLLQDYKNIEIVIADDLSTDNSSKICREYADKEPRIRFLQNKYNLGALGNHRFVFEQSSGDYFAWGSGHDYFHPSFVSRCLTVLEQDKSVIHCCYQTCILDDNGLKERTTTDVLDTRNLIPVDRFITVLKAAGGNADIFYGLYRAETLTQSNPYRNILGTDQVFLTELSLLGATVQLDEVLHYRQRNRQESFDQMVERWIESNIQPRGFSLEAAAPWLDMAYEYIRVIHCSSLSLPDKELLSAEVIGFIREKYGESLKTDLERLFKQVTKSSAEHDSYPNIKAQYAGEVLNSINKAYIFFPSELALHDLRAACHAALGIDQLRLNSINRIVRIIDDRIEYGVIPLIRRCLQRIKGRVK